MCVLCLIFFPNSRFMNRTKLIFLILLTPFLFFSCVTKKKYLEMETMKNRVQGLLDSKNSELRNYVRKSDSLARLLRDCNERTARLVKDSLKFAGINDDLKDKMDDLNATCDQLKDNYTRLKSNSSKKIQELIDQLELLQKDLTDRERKLAEVEAGLRQRDSVMAALRKKVEDALIGFRDQGLTIEVKDGKVYVSLSNKLLFASGSTKVDTRGKDALKELAGVLKGQEDLNIMVEGHTDDVPVSNLGDIKDNWDLSVMRSTEVVRILVKEGVEPSRIIPSGRSEFIPKTLEKTPEARAANRRTEIIISPKLDELYLLINPRP